MAPEINSDGRSLLAFACNLKRRGGRVFFRILTTSPDNVDVDYVCLLWEPLWCILMGSHQGSQRYEELRTRCGLAPASFKGANMSICFEGYNPGRDSSKVMNPALRPAYNNIARSMVALFDLFRFQVKISTSTRVTP
jgi:hypothetical protein